MRGNHVAAVLLSLCLGEPLYAQFHKAEHPFILWTKDDVAAIKKKIETEPWAQDQVKNLPNNTFGNLFKYQVLGDKKAGDTERKYLLSFIGAPLNGKGDVSDNAGLHTANYLSALRYDVLYDSLTDVQRQQLEETFRKHIREELPFSTPVARTGILPNLALPRRCGILIMSVALEDEVLIKEVADKPRSLKWFIEDYLADGQFYGEEFSKMTSIIGEFLIYARGLDRLGMGAYGFDFKGKNGATLKRYVESYLSLGYPRVDMPGPPASQPVYARIAMGDARGGALMPHLISPPPNQDGSPSPALFYAANMNGRDHTGRKIEKLNFPQWFEIIAARFPEAADNARFVLSLQLKQGQDKYIPTLFWGLDPIDPKTVKPPAAPSWVAPERGFAMLRADETPGYWSSPSPAVAMQFAQMYVHNTSDCFSLLGYYSMNRPIYVNRAISAGYNGGPWDFHVRGHAGVVVDNQQAQPIGMVPSRSDFSPLVKFVSARGVTLKPLTGKEEARPHDQPKEPVTEVYSNIDLSRSLFLTNEYLFDVYNLRDKSQKPRDFYWMVHAPGSLQPEDAQAWKPTDELQKMLFHTPWQNPLPPEKRTPEQRLYDAPPSGTDGPDWVTISNTKRFDGGKAPFTVNTLQTYHGDDVVKSKYGADWYARKVGVRISMLGGDDTTAYAFDTPTRYTEGAPRSSDSKDARVMLPEYGGISLAIHRTGPGTTFAALHQPFAGGKAPQTSFREMARKPEGIAVAVEIPDSKVNDRLLLQYDSRPEAAVKATPELEKDAAVQPLTLSGDGETFTFTGHGFVRITPEKVDVTGTVRAMTVKVQGTPKLIVNGKETPATVSGGLLSFGK